MKTEPLVSVIIPSFDNRNVLGRAITSVLGQNYPGIELIIIDDHSSDNTYLLVEKYLEEDKRIKYVYLPGNKGPAYARNIGINEAQGEFIAFLDADDEWCNGKLDYQINILVNQPDIDFLFTDSFIHFLDKNERKLLSSLNSKSFIDLELTRDQADNDVFHIHGPLKNTIYRKCFILISTVIVRKELIMSVGGFDANCFGTEDLDLFVRMANRGKFAYWDKPTVIKYQSSKSISAPSEKRAMEYVRYYKNCFTSPEYENIKEITIYNLERSFKSIIVMYGLKGQRSKVIQTYKVSRYYLSSKRLMMITFLSYLHPKLLKSMLYYKSFKKGIRGNQVA